MREIFRLARQEGRQVLLEHEVYAALDSLGMPTPRYRFLPLEQARAGELGDAAGLPDAAYLKLVSTAILHKSDVGGVVRLRQTSGPAVREAVSMMEAAAGPERWATVQGVLLCEAIQGKGGLGGELLLGMVRSPDFGPVVTAGFGGTGVEALAAATRHGQSTVLFKPGFTSARQLNERLDGALFFSWATGGVRGVDGLCAPASLREQLHSWADAVMALDEAAAAEGVALAELELNPLLVGQDGKLVPVDALARLAPPAPAPPAFPRESLARALRPGSVALMGVSRTMNVGRIILRCILEGGYDPEQITVVRPDAQEIDDVRCVPALQDLPGGSVDLLVLAVAAPAVPDVLRQVLELRCARGVLLIPGGMGETEAGKGIQQEVNALLASHDGPERPCLIGNNSLGFITRERRFDSLFIPRTKLPRPTSGSVGDNVALLSQSGAFMITRASKLDWLSPAYQLSIGNQVDARISHFVEALLEEPHITTLALYIEGFKPGDGERLLELTRRAVDGGRDMVVYRAGRSALGRGATMGHTASIAGDYRVFSRLMTDAGALVADSFDDFADLLTLSATLRGKRFTGRRVALMSNAGFESVGMADNHGALLPARLSAATRARAATALKGAGIAHLVNIDNPLDITPMAGDALYEELARALLEDPDVDAALVGMVPLTPMIQSLPAGVSDRDRFDAEQGYARRFISLFHESDKPLVTVLDGGSIYDPLARLMQDAGVPVFRGGDRAARALERYLAART